VMGSLLSEPYPHKVTDSLTKYSQLGLRTLAFASKQLEAEYVEQWRKQFAEASQPHEDREGKLEALATKMECKLQLVGISAIEDRLQEGVPETIVAIKEAGIRFWVLTGDKVETAVEIVRACRLFTEDMPLAYMVNAQSSEHATQLLEAARKKLEGKDNGGLILDGTLVYFATMSKNDRRLLYDLALLSRACVCCRLSPKQKRNLVELVREQNLAGITLAIGDGANDVSMILGAHVGIGIRGKEGNQAVQASDIAISQFRFLLPLLLCHGRRAYRRVATFLCYYIYKSIVLAIADAIWAHQYGFRGSIAYPEWLSSAYSTFYTSLPVLVVLAMDTDVPDKVAVSSPKLYLEGINRTRFNMKIFSAWLLSAVWHGSLVWLLPNLIEGSDVPGNAANDYGRDPYDQNAIDFWRASCCSFTLVVLVVSIQLWMVALNPLARHVVAVFVFTFLLYIAMLFTLGETSMGRNMQPQIYGVPSDIFSQGKYVLVTLLPLCALLLDYAVFTGFKLAMPSPLDLTRRDLAKSRSSVHSSKDDGELAGQQQPWAARRPVPQSASPVSGGGSPI